MPIEFKTLSDIDRSSAWHKPRLFIDEELRSNPEKFVIDPKSLPLSQIEGNKNGQPQTLTYQEIINQEYGLLLYKPITLYNNAQFTGIIQSVLATQNISIPEGNLPETVRGLLKFKEINEQTKSISLITMDMDDFGQTNSRYTHHYGDMICSILQRTAIEITEPYGGIISGGGEENRIALPLPLQDAWKVAEGVHNKFTAIGFNFGGEELHHQNISMGVASFSHCRPNTIQRLLALTSGALVYSKKHGKGRVTIFGDQ